ncbi:MAG: UvrD-helicase domain-containing protein [Deltaproteobacteria bacterium]|nr:UvrD-helicase domain-containing protein [Deltaproteobacteria bacterium]
MSTVVLASAGTGKTHTLVDAWLRALLGLDDGTAKAAESLLAITFTDKAAAEMKSRIERRLARLRFTPDDEADLLLAFAAAGLPPPDHAVVDAARRSIGRAPIGTFHAMCGRILREHALAAGLDPSFRVLEPDEEQRMLAELAEAVVLDALAATAPGPSGDSGVVVRELIARVPLRGLYEQRGLTESLVAVHQSLAERGFDPAAIPIAMPSSSLEELADRVRAALVDVDATGQKNAQLRAQQAKARLEALLRVHSENAAADDADVEAGLSRLFIELREQVGGSWGGPALTEKRRALVDAVESLGAALVDDTVKATAPGVRLLLAELDRRQRREKEQRAVLAFGDLLVRTRDLLREDKSVRARVKSRFARVFVDEYQDTSPVQEQIVALLVEDPRRGADFTSARVSFDTSAFAQVKVPKNRAFVVGDPKQSIYGFRGADAEVFARVQRELDGATVERLTISRRSTSSVCAFVNVVTAHALPDHVDEVLVPLVNDAVAPVGSWWRAGPAIKALGLPSVEVDAVLVTTKLVALFNEGALAPRDVVVLVRRGRAAAVLGRALSQRGVAVRVVGGDGFWRRPEVQDIVSALSLVVDPGDDLAALAVLRSPLVGVPDDQILALFEAWPTLREGFSWSGIVAAASDAIVDVDVAGRIRAFDALLLALRTRLAVEPLTRAIDLLLDEGGYAIACAVEPDAALRLRHLEKLRTLCAGRPEEGVLAIARLVDALDDPPPEPVLFDAPDDDDCVRIMTIHQSKGLEAEVVVLADAGIGLRTEGDDVLFDPIVGLAVSARGRPIHRCTPKATSTTLTAIQRVRKAKRERDERELRRLLYVSITRARRGLFVAGEARRRGPGSLLGLLDQARNADVAAFDALLPELVVEEPAETRFTSTSHETKKSASASRFVTLAADEMKRLPRLRASTLLARATPQLTIGLTSEPGGGDGNDEDVLPPRARGRLAHAVIALVAGECPEVLGDPAATVGRVHDALRATGAPQDNGVTAVDDALVSRIVATLCGPVRALLLEGRALLFEEPVVLVTDIAIVEGTADLVARGPKDVVVVEFKLSPGAARAPGSIVQVQACCAAIAQREDTALRYAVWAIGDVSPAKALPFGPPARRELATILARLAHSAGRGH